MMGPTTLREVKEALAAGAARPPAATPATSPVADELEALARSLAAAAATSDVRPAAAVPEEPNQPQQDAAAASGGRR